MEQENILRKTAGRAEGEGAGAQLTRFAKQLGSTKGLDPIPPDQYLTFQDQRYASHKIRLWAWVLANTIRAGRRSVFCVNTRGRALTLQHAAADLHLDEANVRRAWRALEKEGRVSRDGWKLCLKGEVTLPEGDTLPGEGENKKRSEVCTNPLPPYISNQINKLSPEIRDRFLVEFEADSAFQKRIQAELMAAVRFIFDQRQDNRFTRFEINKIRIEEKRRAVTREFTDVVLPLVSGFVQTFSGFVQTSKVVCTDASGGSVQTHASLLTSEDLAESSERSSSSSSPLCSAPTMPTTTNGQNQNGKTPNAEEPSIPEIYEVMATHGCNDLEAAKNMVAACRKLAPDCTAEEIRHFVHVKGRLARHKENPTGFLLIAVPNCFQGEPFQQFRREQFQEAERAARFERARKAEADALHRAEEAREALQARLRLYPEECPHCQGDGVHTPPGARMAVFCDCPKGQARKAGKL